MNFSMFICITTTTNRIQNSSIIPQKTLVSLCSDTFFPPLAVATTDLSL